MTKKLICLAMAAMMIFTGCRGAEAPAESAPASTPASSTGEAPAESLPQPRISRSVSSPVPLPRVMRRSPRPTR